MRECAAMIRRAFILLLCFILVPSVFAQVRRRAATATDTLVIGGLFSLTGDGATLGRASEAALRIAARDINTELAELRYPFRVSAVIADTKLQPALALEKLEELHAAGAQVVIGPQSSAEAAAIRAYADEHRIIVISQGSTASSLAIAGDHLFRLAPNDKLEGAAMAALMRADGIDTLVPIWRADAGNTGLRDSTKRFFDAAGGMTLAGVSYDPATTDFHAQVAALGAAVRSAPANAHVAVYLASFEEGAAIIDLARLDADLSRVRWYGGDGLTQSQALLASAPVAAFAAATKFTAPGVGLGDTTRDRWQPLSNEIRDAVGFLPDAFSLSVYDAAWVAVLSETYATDPDLRRAAFVRTVQRYWGVTGPLALDEAGDRKFADFDFWTVQSTNKGLDWVRTAQYVSGRVVR
jgi:branched-chain amino acid transport system substrate-binding protein